MKQLKPEAFRKFLALYGLTVIDVCAHTGLHFNTIYRFLSGRGVAKSTIVAISHWMENEKRSVKASAS